MCFSSSSSSSQSSKVYDERVGADGEATAFRAEGENNITVGSDDTAQMAIEGTTNALTASTEFLGDILTKALNFTDRSSERASANVDANRQLAADVIAEGQESADERLITLFKYGLLTGVSIYAFKSGAFKDVMGVLK